MFVSMVAGAVFVVIFGIIMMLVLYAGNLDTLLMVSPAVTDICCSFVVILFQGALGPSAVQVSSSTPSHNIIDLNCTGNESSIFECPFNGLVGHYSCSNTRDANAYCQGIIALLNGNQINCIL